MAKIGQARLVNEALYPDIDFGVRYTKVLNIVTDTINGIAYTFVNVATDSYEEIQAGEWYQMYDEGKHDNRVYVNKTLDEVIALLRYNSADTVEWVNAMTEVE